MDYEIQKTLSSIRKVNKEKIDYGSIDLNLRNVIRGLNQLPFLATVGCCEGHRRVNRFTGRPIPSGPAFSEMYIAFEVYDEDKYDDLVERVTAATSSLTSVAFKAEKLYPEPHLWKWGFHIEDTRATSAQKKLEKIRRQILEVSQQTRVAGNASNASDQNGFAEETVI